MPARGDADHPFRPVAVGGVVAAALALAMGFALATGIVDPATLLVPGRAGPSADVVTEDFGAPDNPLPGYDGQQVYAIARAFPDLDAASDDLDDPAYRSLRILQPALASPAPAGAPLVYALFCLGAIGVGIAVAAIADLARPDASAAAIGLAAIPALLLPLALTTTEALAYGLAFGAVALLRRDRWIAAVALATMAVLTRETALGVIALGAVALLPSRRTGAALTVGVPTVVLVAWMWGVRQLLPGRDPERFELLGLRHLSTAALVVVVGVVALGLFGAWAWRDVATLWPVALGFACLPFLFRPEVLDVLALPRVVAPTLVLGATGVSRRLVGNRPASDRVSGR